jgi:predicted MFS family arabinose efflux permease
MHLELGKSDKGDIAGSTGSLRALLVTATSLAVAPLVVNGLARFAYALLLPAMQADLRWSYSQAGAMNTANAAGYLIGALLTARISAHLGERQLFAIGVFGTAASLFACGLTDGMGALLLLRFTAGLFGAPAFVSGAAIAAREASGMSRERQSLLIGIYFGGAGLGIALSSAIVPIVLSDGPQGWRVGWEMLGTASALAALLALPAVRGRGKFAESGEQHRQADEQGPPLIWISISYLLFGAGYIAYMTFIVAYLRGEGFGGDVISAFWTLLGLSCLAAGFGWERLLARLRGGRQLAVVLSMCAVGAAAPVMIGGLLPVFVSAVLFGASLTAGPAAVTAFVRRARAPRLWTANIGRLTVLFGIGQCAGPLMAGIAADGRTGIRFGLLLSVVILVAAIFAAAMQPRETARS